MTDPTDPRSKAEASLRLAELAKSPRAKELFRQLASEYEDRARAGLGVPVAEVAAAEAAPSIVPASPATPVAEAEPGTPMADTQQWLDNLASVREER